MPTRENLDKRGIDLDSIRCPLCDDDVETEDHLFVSCKLSADIWIDVFKWWDLTNVSPTSLNDMMYVADHAPIEDKHRRYFDVVIQTTILAL